MTRHRHQFPPACGLCVLALALVLAACSSLNPFADDETEEDTDTASGGERLSILELSQALAVDPRLADMPVVLPPPAANPVWTQPGGVPSHVLEHVALGERLTEAFAVDAGEGSTRNGRLTAVPIIADGRVYVLDTRAHVRAFDAAEGRELWEADLRPEDERSDAGFGGGIAFEGGRLFVSTGFGDMHALEAASGTVLWTRHVGVPLRASPTVAEGRVFVTSYDNRLFAFASNEGTLLWPAYRGIEESAGVLASPSPAVVGEFVVAPFSSGEVTAIRADNGRPAWSDSLTRTGQLTAMSSLNDVAGRPVIGQGRVFAISHSGRLVSIDLRSGERVWERNVAGVQTPWLAGEFLFLVTVESELAAISARDGRVRWIAQLRRWEDEEDAEDPVAWVGPVLAGGRLYLASSDEELIAVDPTSGTILETIELPDAVYVAPVVAGGTLYLLTDGGRLLAYR